MITARDKVGEVVVESYGRLLAFLAARFGDVTAAEDALADALLAAVRKWPESGVPERPEAWLLAVARNSLRDASRRRVVQDTFAELLRKSEEYAANPGFQFPDERLKLLFVCAHPAIEEAARTPLMLQVVLGLDAARVAQAFVVSPAAMGQRLSRAKAKISAAGIAFAVPEPRELPERLQSVLEAIYGAYGLAWNDLSSGETDLAHEAIWLARTVVTLLPQEAEARALLSLLLHAEARRAARRDESGAFVPLSEQDTQRWSGDMQIEAEGHLLEASRLRLGSIGSFQLEAAIQSAHASRAKTGQTPWRGIAGLYDALVRIRPSLGAYVGRAAAHGAAFGAARGLALLEETAQFKSRFEYQPYWVCLAHLQQESEMDATAAFDRAIELTSDESNRAHLQKARSAR